MKSTITSKELSPAGMSLLNRRSFLKHSSTALGSMALASLLADDGVLGSPIRPKISPERPYAPRKTHFPARAKQVLLIYCTGAVHQTPRTAAPRERNTEDIPGRERQPHAAAVHVPPARGVRQADQRPAPRAWIPCRRRRLRSLPDQQDQYPWPRRDLHVDRLHPRGFSFHGSLDVLCSWNGK